MISDFAKFDRPGLLHLAFQALDRYQQESSGRKVPRPYSNDDAQKFVEYAKKINNSAANKVGVALIVIQWRLYPIRTTCICAKGCQLLTVKSCSEYGLLRTELLLDVSCEAHQLLLLLSHFRSQLEYCMCCSKAVLGLDVGIFLRGWGGGVRGWGYAVLDVYTCCSL